MSIENGASAGSASSPGAEVGTDRDLINGSRVVERTKAKLPNPVRGGELFAQPDIDEVLLENGEVWYQCASRNGSCNAAYARPRSVMSHLKAHSPRAVNRRLNEELEAERARAAELDAELTRRRESLSNRAKKAAQTRQENRRNGHAVTHGGDSEVTIEFTEVARSLASAATQLEAGIGTLNLALSHLQQAITQLPQLPVADPALIEAARKYEALRGLIKD
jgi:hypothetical protein